jgi:hypothetical protein
MHETGLFDKPRLGLATLNCHRSAVFTSLQHPRNTNVCWQDRLRSAVNAALLREAASAALAS